MLKALEPCDHVLTISEAAVSKFEGEGFDDFSSCVLVERTSKELVACVDKPAQILTFHDLLPFWMKFAESDAPAADVKGVI